jgi:AcrR family transcriptional regulator
MKRDAQSTRQRILAAATAEFSRYGIAGARIDRIADAAGSNKSMIYTYYESKDRLFDAVFDASVVHCVDDVPIDARDLPEYAARLFDQNRTRPDLIRLGAWDWLERGGAGMRIAAVAQANEHKVDAIRRAQRDRVISAHVPAATLLELILALSLTGLMTTDGHEDPAEVGRRRQAIKDAVDHLVHD